MRHRILLALFLLVSCFATAQTTRLVKDIDPRGLNMDRCQTIFPFGDTIFAVVQNVEDGRELAVLDANGAWGRSLKSIGPGAESAWIESMASLGGTYYFGISGPFAALWHTDGTVLGTDTVTTLPSGLEVKKIVPQGQELLLICESSSTGIQIWKTDGTRTGTQLVESLGVGGYVGYTGVLGGKHYFATANTVAFTDGTPGNGGVIGPNTGLNYYSVSVPIIANGKLWFLANEIGYGNELWTSDGTLVGTTMVEDYKPGSGNGVDATYPLVAMGGNVYYVSMNVEPAFGKEVRYHNGTVAGMIDYTPGPSSSNIYNLAATDSRVYFYEALAGQLVAATPSSIDNLGNHSLGLATISIKGDTMCFSGFGGLILTDGTLPGTINLTPNMTGVYAQYMWHNGAIYYQAYDQAGALRMYRSDGSVSGTSVLARVDGGGNSGAIDWPTAIGSSVVFAAKDSAHPVHGLWKTDGTAAGTTFLATLEPDSTRSATYNEHTDLNGVMIGEVGNSVHGQELWRSDGTPSGTYLLKEIMPGSGSSYPHWFFEDGNTLFFSAKDNVNGATLWRTDGTTAGTQLVLPVTNPGSLNDAKLLMKLGNDYLVSTYQNTQTSRLILTDGTPGNATILHDFGNPTNLPGLTNTYFDGKCFLIAQDSTLGYQMWSTEGTVATTLRFPVIQPNSPSIPKIWGVTNGKMLFSAEDAQGEELWVSDGTVQGTQLLKDINPGGLGSFLKLLAIDENHAFFSAAVPFIGTELWVSDGTAAGTFMLRDAQAGNGSTAFSSPILSQGHFYFLYENDDEGMEIGESDGTIAGTHFHSLYPGPRNGAESIIDITSHGLLFQGHHQNLGMNLFLLDSGVISALPDPTADPQSFSVKHAVPFQNGYIFLAWHPSYGEEVFAIDSITAVVPTAAVVPVAPTSEGWRVSAFPIPSSGVVHLRLPEDAPLATRCTLMDLTGHVVYDAALAPTHACDLTLSDLSSGMYVARLTLRNGSFAIAKLLRE